MKGASKGQKGHWTEHAEMAHWNPDINPPNPRRVEIKGCPQLPVEIAIKGIRT